MFALVGPSVTYAVGFLILTSLSGSPALGAGQTKKVRSATPQANSAAGLTAPSRSKDAVDLTPGYVVKASDVSVPPGVPPGQYRRITRPFANWTLICDENLVKKQKVCNVSQTILGPSAATVFSWSLAAAQDGQPFFIMRVPPDVGDGGSIQLDLRDGRPVLLVPIKGCNEAVCLAYQPVGQRLRAAVEKGTVVQVSYAAGAPPQAISFRAPLAGLASALAVI